MLCRCKIESFLPKSHTFLQLNGYTTLTDISKVGFIISTEFILIKSYKQKLQNKTLDNKCRCCKGAKLGNFC